MLHALCRAHSRICQSARPPPHRNPESISELQGGLSIIVFFFSGDMGFSLPLLMWICAPHFFLLGIFLHQSSVVGEPPPTEVCSYLGLQTHEPWLRANDGLHLTRGTLAGRCSRQLNIRHGGAHNNPMSNRLTACRLTNSMMRP